MFQPLRSGCMICARRFGHTSTKSIHRRTVFPLSLDCEENVECFGAASFANGKHGCVRFTFFRQLLFNTVSLRETVPFLPRSGRQSVWCTAIVRSSSC